ncbi:hypothetical protein [Kiritimatiella glycovorans]|nr:hypothetical protein [Kiritimatiella glycovorans]
MFILILSTAGAAVLLCGANLWLGDLNQDEGWYLLAARSVAEGRIPYADFAFTQGPVLPFVYAVFAPLVRAWGVAGGRLITACFGAAAALLAAWTAFRSVRERTAGGKDYAAVAACATLALILLNCYQSYFTTVVKTYGLAATWIAAGFLALTFRRSLRFGGMACFWSGFFFALAAGTRLSAGILLPVVGVWLISRSGEAEANRERFNSRGQYLGRQLNWVCFGIGGAFVLALWMLPFLLIAPEEFRFGMLGYHSGREPGGLMEALVLKAGFVSRFVQAYYLWAVLTLASMLLRFRRDRERSGTSAPACSPGVLWAGGAAVTLVHLIAPFPYDDYQAIIYPVLAVALVVALVPLIPRRLLPGLAVLVVLASLAGAGSSPINQQWFVRGRDRIWWKFKERPDLVKLRDAGAFIRARTPAGSILLTQDAYLAVEADRRVPREMEMGPFSYYPDMERERAERLHLLNRAMLTERLRTADAPMAAFSGYGLTIACPEIQPLPAEETERFYELVRERFRPVREIEHFGQGHTLLRIYTSIY